MGRRRNFPVRRQKDQIWVPFVLAETTVAANGNLKNTLVDGADWADNATGLERATMLTMRGYIAGSPDTATTSDLVTPLAYICLVHEDALASLPVPSDILAYVEDILWTGGGPMYRNVLNTTTVNRQLPGFMWEVNIQSRRRITDQQDLVLVVQALGAISVTFMATLRTLIRRV